MNLLRDLPSRARRPIVVAGLAAVLALVAWAVVAADDDERAAAPQPSTAPRPAASDPRAPAVVNDYRAYWAALLKASDPADPNHADLLRHVTGAELGRARTVLTARRQSGEVVRGSYEHRETVQSIGDRVATVDDCLSARTAVYEASSGKVKVQDPQQDQPLTVALQLDGGVWKVSEIKPGVPGACTRPAA
ncbi:hypothetical protein ABZS66_23570 [Dactylosporangium sp. NPDC005572]|uniref:hypothetical protein n=1 Tax=Dactylosporangium sp. NPDC005572 TaxID=3156889 RepID=UPI0033A8DDB7